MAVKCKKIYMTTRRVLCIRISRICKKLIHSEEKQCLANLCKHNRNSTPSWDLRTATNGDEQRQLFKRASMRRDGEMFFAIPLIISSHTSSVLHCFQKLVAHRIVQDSLVPPFKCLLKLWIVGVDPCVPRVQLVNWIIHQESTFCWWL